MLVLLGISNCITVNAMGSSSECRDNLTVITYNHILPEKDIREFWEKDSSVVSLVDFENQMKYLKENKYNIVTMKEVKNYIYNLEYIPEKSVLITFDNGYKSDFEYAYPVLKKYNFKATVFLVTSKIEERYEENFNSEILQHGSEYELKKCSDVFSYGDESFRLYRKDMGNDIPIMKIKTKEEINYDLKISQAIIGKYVDEGTKAFAYPDDTYNENVQWVLKKNEYKLVFLSNNKKVSKNINPYKIPRYAITSQKVFDSLFRKIETSQGKMKSKEKSNLKVLMYHHILPRKDIKGPWENNSSVLSLEDFENQMRFLKENKYNIVEMKEAKNYIYNIEDLPEKSVLITFDDGYKSNFEYAYPVLKKYAFKATIFLITSKIEEYYEQKFISENLQYASEYELNKCSNVFSYGDHTYRLHRKDDESRKAFMNIKTKEQINNDINISQAILSKYVDEDTKVFAYPYGKYNEISQSVLKSKDYKLVFLINKGEVSKKTNPYEIPRYGITSQRVFDSVFK